MTKNFETPEFLNYLQKKLDLEPFLLRDLMKEHSIFEAVDVIFDPQYMKSIPKEYLKMQVVLPLYKFGPAITVATARPTNPYLQNNIEKQLHSVISLVFSFPSDIINYIEKHYTE